MDKLSISRRARWAQARLARSKHWRGQVVAGMRCVPTLALFSASAALGTPTILDFEDIAAGTSITTQYSQRGVLFVAGFLGTDPAAPSGTQVLRNASLRDKTFDQMPMVMTFTSLAQSRVKLSAMSTDVASEGTLIAFDAAGEVVAQDGPKPVAANGFTTTFEVTDPDTTPSIARAELHLENGRGGRGEGSRRIHFAIDDLEFEAFRIPQFLVKAYAGTIAWNGGKCLDFEEDVVGAPIVLNDCAVSHAFTVVELPIESPERLRNRVQLVWGDKIIGLALSSGRPPVSDGFQGSFPPVAPPVAQPAEVPLVLQSRKRVAASGAVWMGESERTFILDGDSIILASNRDLVAQVKNGRGANRTPIVMGPRNLTDAEFWEFSATDGSSADPTSAFVTVDSFEGVRGLKTYLRLRNNHEEYPRPLADGTVVRIKPTEGTIVIDTTDAFDIPAGVTIRGDRRGRSLGPLLQKRKSQVDANDMFAVKGADVRVTGLRLRGPNHDRDKEDLHIATRAIQMGDTQRIIIDHNEFYDWYGTAVLVSRGETNAICDNRPIRNIARVSRNFMHHNLMQGEGYGVNVKAGGSALIDGNLFSWNRHAIAMTRSTGGTIYRARHNLVLSSAPKQTWHGIADWYTHDFDVHGTAGDEGTGCIWLGADGFGGRGGRYADIYRNTFLGDNRLNFKLRGIPCEYVEFHENVSMHDEKDDAVEVQLGRCGGYPSYAPPPDELLHVPRPGGQFGRANPVFDLRVGDFDGDGFDDLFLATGAAWYYAPAGQAPWSLLSAMKDNLPGTLRFGDFDGDGRTDVIRKSFIPLQPVGILNRIMVSWGGSSEWQVLHSTEAPIAIDDVAVGDFDGDSVDDIFLADGATWWVSSGGTGSFEVLRPDQLRVKDLLFGDFNRSGRTDVFADFDGFWQISFEGFREWERIQPSLAPIHGGPVGPPSADLTGQPLFVADFDGDNRDDIVQQVNDDIPGSGTRASWRFSLAGLSDWVPLAKHVPSMAAAGHFRGENAADLLVWHPDPFSPFSSSSHLAIAYWGSPVPVQYSVEEMR